MAHIVGIDIGADSIKAALFEGSLGRYNLKGFQEKVIPDGEEPLGERQDRALEDLIGSLPKDTRSYVAYPYHKLSSKHVTLPFTDQKKVEQTLAFYIEDQIPFDIDEVILSHRVLEIKEKDTDIFLAVCPKNALQQNLDRLSAININPEMLPIDADLLGNCCTEDYEIIIDIGHSRVLCVLTKESKAILVRSLRHGVGQIHDVIREHHKDTTQILHDFNMNEPTVAVAEEDGHPDVDTLIFRQIQQLSNAIRQLLIRLEDQFGIEIPSIKICGGGAEICGIEQFLSEEMGVPVEKSLLPMETSNNPSPQRFTLAYWIGQCATGNSHGRELNLRTGDFSYQGNLEKLGSLLRVMGIAATAILILGFAWFGYNYMTLRRELNTLNSDALAIFSESLPEFPVPEDSETALTLVNAEVLEKTEQIQSLQKLFPKEPPVLSKIQAFSSHLPSHTQARIDVTEMTISKTSINVRAETDQFEQATLIVQELQKYALFSEAQKADEKNAAKGIRFNIVIPLNAQQEE